MNEHETFFKTLEAIRHNAGIVQEAEESMDFEPNAEEENPADAEYDKEAELGRQNKEKIINRFRELVDEYIGEAEHQDGYGYWNNFKNVKEFVKDFELYVDATPDTPEVQKNTNPTPVKENFGMPVDIEDIERAEVGGESLPIEFSETIQNMTVGELLNQIKGTSQDLYTDLTNFLKDVYHEQQPEMSCGGMEEQENTCSCCDGTTADSEGQLTSDVAMAAIPQVIKHAIGRPGPMVKRVMVVRGESEQKLPDADLLIEAYKVKKQLKASTPTK